MKPHDIKEDKSLWEKVNIEGVGKVLLVEESYYNGIVELVEKLQAENEQIKAAYQDRVDDIDMYVKVLKGIEEERLKPNKEAYERLNKIGEIARAYLGIEDYEI